MPLNLYCCPTAIKYLTGRSDEYAERVCRNYLGQSRQVKGMSIEQICRVMESLGFEVLEHKNIGDYLGKPILSTPTISLFKSHSSWFFCIIKTPGVRGTHLITVSKAEYKDAFTDGEWRHIKDLGRVILMDCWVLAK